ncbi:MAG TPA: twin-arginine translocation signal domain-containing protein, partial [Vicinamibacterales bacterium]
MSKREADESTDTPRAKATTPGEARRADPLADTRNLTEVPVPAGVNRRSFLMRTAVGGAAAVMTGCAPSPEDKTAKAVATAQPAAAP